MQKLWALWGTPISPTQNLVLEQQFEIQGVTTVEQYFGTRTCCYTVDSEIERLFGIGAAPWWQSSRIPIFNEILRRQKLGGLMVQLRIVSWTVLMEGQLCSSEDFSKAHCTAASLGSP